MGFSITLLYMTLILSVCYWGKAHQIQYFLWDMHSAQVRLNFSTTVSFHFLVIPYFSAVNLKTNVCEVVRYRDMGFIVYYFVIKVKVWSRVSPDEW